MAAQRGDKVRLRLGNYLEVTADGRLAVAAVITACTAIGLARVMGWLWH